ncbi:hypothetical protein J6590_009732 [Homalodisca vitripennis]|nr:hypothetical protein J6590_009732 [Homalodisca vitripennis]
MKVCNKDGKREPPLPGGARSGPGPELGDRRHPEGHREVTNGHHYPPPPPNDPPLLFDVK